MLSKKLYITNMPCDYTLLPHEGIKTLHPYIPGKSVDELTTELGLTDIIKLASNENPLGCSQSVIDAISALTGKQYASYAIPASHPLRAKLAHQLGVDREMIMLGNGSDALIPLLQTCFALHRQSHILTHEYAFISYKIHAQTLGITVIETPLLPNWQVDINALLKACNHQTALIFFASPNNPTGLTISAAEIERVLQNVPDTTLVVLDEAYYEFSTYAASKNTQPFFAIPALAKYPNLIITRTFSKAYGLAGLRLGYIIASPQIVSILLRAYPPFMVNEAALTAGMAALEDTHFLKQTLSNNLQGLKQLQQGLSALGYDVLESKANFITFDCKKDTEQLYQALLQRGIIVRPLHQYGLNNYFRVTVGTPAQNKRFLEIFQELEHDKK